MLFVNRQTHIYCKLAVVCIDKRGVGVVNNPAGGCRSDAGRTCSSVSRRELKVMPFASCVEPLAYLWEISPWKTKALLDRVTLVFTHFPGYPTAQFLTSVSSCAQTPPTVTAALSDWLPINLISVLSMCHLSTSICVHNKSKYKVCTYTCLHLFDCRFLYKNKNWTMLQRKKLELLSYSWFIHLKETYLSKYFCLIKNIFVHTRLHLFDCNFLSQKPKPNYVKARHWTRFFRTLGQLG